MWSRDFDGFRSNITKTINRKQLKCRAKCCCVVCVYGKQSCKNNNNEKIKQKLVLGRYYINRESQCMGKPVFQRSTVLIEINRDTVWGLILYIFIRYIFSFFSFVSCHNASVIGIFHCNCLLQSTINDMVVILDKIANDVCSIPLVVGKWRTIYSKN